MQGEEVYSSKIFAIVSMNSPPLIALTMAQKCTRLYVIRCSTVEYECLRDNVFSNHVYMR